MFINKSVQTPSLTCGSSVPEKPKQKQKKNLSNTRHIVSPKKIDPARFGSAWLVSALLAVPVTALTTDSSAAL